MNRASLTEMLARYICMYLYCISPPDAYLSKFSAVHIHRSKFVLPALLKFKIMIMVTKQTCILENRSRGHHFPYPYKSIVLIGIHAISFDFQVLGSSSQSGALSAQLNAEYRQSAISSLSFYAHFGSPRNAALWRRVCQKPSIF